MKITYGLAEFDRYTGTIDSNIHLPMDGVLSGGLYEFLESAGEAGWELCSAYPCGTKGNSRPIPGKTELRKCEDPTEVITFIFKRV
jgi:hypothetical protein